MVHGMSNNNMSISLSLYLSPFSFFPPHSLSPSPGVQMVCQEYDFSSKTPFTEEDIASLYPIVKHTNFRVRFLFGAHPRPTLFSAHSRPVLFSAHLKSQQAGVFSICVCGCVCCTIDCTQMD